MTSASGPTGALLEALCAGCRRTTYVRDGGEMACPVCSSPLVPLNASSESEAS
ncbi:MAG: hypothetical protein M3271_08545 [Actinomycetota bacterium]|nr:hypothetical protein [Actinomycetota bacterium]